MSEHGKTMSGEAEKRREVPKTDFRGKRPAGCVFYLLIDV
jgi:hypothetical protein